MATQATLRYIAFDILRSIKELHPSASITLAQVVYWILVHADRIKEDFLNKTRSKEYLVQFDVDVVVEPTTGRNYFVLPTNIYDLDDERGIEYITYEPAIDPDRPVFTSIQFTRTTIPKSRRLYFRKDETPTPDNPFFYRVGSNIYLLGVEQINLITVEVGLHGAFNTVDSTLDLDKVFEFPQFLLPELKQEILEMGLFVVKMPKEYDENVKESSINSLTKKELPS